MTSRSLARPELAPRASDNEQSVHPVHRRDGRVDNAGRVDNGARSLPFVGAVGPCLPAAARDWLFAAHAPSIASGTTRHEAIRSASPLVKLGARAEAQHTRAFARCRDLAVEFGTVAGLGVTATSSEQDDGQGSHGRRVSRLRSGRKDSLLFFRQIRTVNACEWCPRAFTEAA
jgi:hypothetical protein